MPPKTRYQREDVIRAAVSVVEAEGLEALTARSVADTLGSSTAPVYQHFPAMEALAMEVIRHTQRTMLEYTSRPYTDRVFLNMGTGIAMFACEHPRLYRALLLGSDSYREVVAEVLNTLEAELVKDKRFVSLSEVERHNLLRKMWTFTHGLASLICVGLVKECSREYVVNTLLDVGSDVIGATMARHSKETEKAGPRR